MDSVFRNATNTTSVPSYWLINSTASYAVNSHLTLRVNGNNLADAEYVDRIGGGHYIPGPGRQVMVTATIKSVAQMLLQIPDVLTAEQVAHGRRMLDAADWVDGRVTAGHQSAQAKDNVQIPEGHPVARELGEMILRRAAAESALHFGGAAAARISAALQSLLGRAIVRHPRRQLHPAGARHGASHSDGSVGDAVFLAARRVRRRRADDRGHLRRASVKLPAGPWCSIPRPACTTCVP